jgi:glucokinase
VRYVVAVDIGGTDIKAALVNENLEVISSSLRPTPKNDGSATKTIAAIKEIVDKLSEGYTVSALGVCVCGVFDDADGICIWSGNLDWKNIHLQELLAEKLGIPVVAGHDIRTAGTAEMRSGAALGYSNSIFIAIGTGIAASLVIDGAIRSAAGYAGEIGHLNVGGNAQCVCGRTGCLEAEASALAISTAYEKASGSSGVSTEEIATLVREGNPIAQKVWGDAMLALARACETLITTLSPEAIIFGGGLAKSRELLIDPISSELDKRLTFQRKPELKIAHYDSKAGTIGSAMAAFDLINGAL